MFERAKSGCTNPAGCVLPEKPTAQKPFSREVDEEEVRLAMELLNRLCNTSVVHQVFPWPLFPPCHMRSPAAESTSDIDG